MSLPDLLDRAAARPTDPLGVDRLWHQGRRRRQRRQAAIGAAVAAVTAAAVFAFPSTLTSDREGVALAPGGDPGQPPTPWQDLTLAGAIDRLVAINESLPAQTQPDGTRVTRTVSAYLNTTVDGGSETSAFEVALREVRFSPDGSGVIALAAISEAVDPGTDAERLREIVAQADLDALTLEEERVGPGELSQADVDAALSEAERLAAARPPLLPLETETERSSQAAAAIAVADALRETVPSPQQRVRALRVLADLDPAFVQYGGVVRDLLGREGIGIELLDEPQASGRKDVLIFSTETGEVTGELSLSLTPLPGEPELYGFTAILEATVVAP